MLSLTTNEKAISGGLATALFTVIVELQQQSGGFTLHEFLVALVGYLVTHSAVWLTTNSKKPPQPVVITPSSPPLTAPLPDGKPLEFVPPSFSSPGV